jgi:hypothetical protein
VASWTLGFLWPILRFSDFMASLGCTVLDRITSDISRFSGMSSLHTVSVRCYSSPSPEGHTHRLEDVARSICSSKALFVEDPNQPAMVSERIACKACVCGSIEGVAELWAGLVELLVQWAAYESVGVAAWLSTEVRR